MNSQGNTITAKLVHWVWQGKSLAGVREENQQKKEAEVRALAPRVW